MDVDEALAELLGNSRTGDHLADLRAAALETLRRRQRNSDVGGAVLRALHDSGMSWRAIGELLGCSHETARQWADPTP